MPTRARRSPRTKPAIARPARTTRTRDTPPAVSPVASAHRPVPLSSFSPDLRGKRREPPGRAASRSTEDRGSISALLAPAVGREAQAPPQSRPENPSTREHEAHLTSWMAGWRDGGGCATARCCAIAPASLARRSPPVPPRLVASRSGSPPLLSPSLDPRRHRVCRARRRRAEPRQDLVRRARPLADRAGCPPRAEPLDHPSERSSHEVL